MRGVPEEEEIVGRIELVDDEYAALHRDGLWRLEQVVGAGEVTSTPVRLPQLWSQISPHLHIEAVVLHLAVMTLIADEIRATPRATIESRSPCQRRLADMSDELAAVLAAARG
jgi:hypothetical protein